jgi:hypothetical protein
MAGGPTLGAMTTATSPLRARSGRVVIGALAPSAMVAGLLAGLGWLYLLRGLHWLRFGPTVHDALPLLALAGFDGQPLARVVVAWLLAGALTGVALRRLDPGRRLVFSALMAAAVLLLAAQASYALTRNLRLADVLWSHAPRGGPVLEALVFALGCALPRRLPGGERAD